MRGVPGGKLFLVPDRELRCVRRGNVSGSDGADELRGLSCGKVPGCDGADELQELYCWQYFDDYQGYHLCLMRRRRVPGSGWADELRGLSCGKVPGCDGTDELQGLYSWQYFDDCQGYHLCLMRRR